MDLSTGGAGVFRAGWLRTKMPGTSPGIVFLVLTLRREGGGGLVAGDGFGLGDLFAGDRARREMGDFS